MDSSLFHPPLTFAAVPPPYGELEGARCVVLPVPYDSTTEWRGGSRDGPMAIIDASQYLEHYDLELDWEPYLVGIHTLPELEPSFAGPEPTIERVRAVVSELAAQDKLVAMLGGEHSITVGAVRALVERHPSLSVLQLDAHADLRSEYMGTPYSHACVMRRVVESCPIVPVGIRSMSIEERDFISQQGIEPFIASGAPMTQGELSSIVRSLSGEVYITVDLDVFDPSLMPAVGTPEPGGLGWHQVLDIVRLVAGERLIVGFDIVELCPAEGQHACAYLAARLAYKLIGYALHRERGAHPHRPPM